MSFPRYGKYKDTGVEWLGEVPAHWHVCPVGTIAHIVNGYPFDSERFSTTEGYPLVRIRDLNQAVTDTKYKGSFVESAAITSSDVLIGMDGDFNVGRWLGSEKALLNQRMCCVRAQSDLLTRLLEHTLPIPLRAINDLTYATTVKHLSSSQIEKTRVALPKDLDEQSCLLFFLDHETAKIDALIEEQQRLIELLKEKRQAVISHAVTKGLKTGTPLTDSGIEWLGATPEHWRKLRIGAMFREVNEAGVDGLPILSVSIHHGVSDKQLDDEEMDRTVVRSDDQTKYKRVCSGDLVYNMMRAWQGGFGTVNVEGMVSPAYVVGRPSDGYLSRFVEFILRTPCAVEEMRRYSQGVTDFRLRLYWDKFKCIQLSIPPLSEQEDILSYIETKTAEFDRLTEASEQAIAILHERRTALISAAVTGKIDVRNYSPKEVA